MALQIQPYTMMELANGSGVAGYSSNDYPHVLDLRWFNPYNLPDSTLMPRGLDYSYHCRIIKDCMSTIVYNYDKEALQSMLDYEYVNNFFFKFSWQGWDVSIRRRGTSVMIQHTCSNGAWFDIDYDIDENGEWHGTEDFPRSFAMLAAAFDWRQFFREQAWRRGAVFEVKYEINGYLVYGGENPSFRAFVAPEITLQGGELEK